jgi:hypothetical protein
MLRGDTDMLSALSSTFRSRLSLLLVPAGALALSACDGAATDPSEALAPALEESLASLPEAPAAAPDLNDPATMNVQIMAGTRAFARAQGIEALWTIVAPEKVGNIQSVSADRTKVLFLGAATGSDGFMVPTGELWLADLRAGTLVSVGAAQGLALHAGALSPDGLHIAAVGGDLGHLYMTGTDRIALARAVENDGQSSIAELTWHPDSERLGFVVSPMAHRDVPPEHLMDTLSDDELPTARLAWVSVGSEARTIDRVSVAMDGLAHVPGVRWDGDALTLGEPALAPGQDGADFEAQGYCAPAAMIRAGNYIGLKLPWGSGAASLVQDDCHHINRSDQLDFDFDGGPLEGGGAIRAIAAGKVISLVTTVADPPTAYDCTNNTDPSYNANYVVLQHFGASNTAFTSLYWHLRRSPAVPVTLNQQVSQGTVLGYNGCTGYAYGEHLHFGMRAGSTFTYYGDEAVPEPIDGYSNLDAGNNYTSTNGSGTPPPPPSGNMLKREGANFALNGYSPYDGRELTVWTYNTSDPEQRWNILAPGTIGNAGTMIRRNGTNFCVNAVSLYDYAPVNLWTCSAGDPDQQFDRIDYGSSRLYRRRGTNFCLNGHEMFDYGKVTLWTCNTADVEQRWVVQ